VRKVVLAALVGVLVAALAGGSYALARDGGGKKSFRAHLDGWQEVPSQVTTGKGRFHAKVVGGNTIAYTLRYEDLEGDAAQAHIHIGGTHENGDVSAFLCGGGDKPPCPPREGEVSGVIDAADVIGPANQGVEPGNIADLIRAMQNRDGAYVNVHTTRAGGGEIRGDLRHGDD